MKTFSQMEKGVREIIEFYKKYKPDKVLREAIVAKLELLVSPQKFVARRPK